MICVVAVILGGFLMEFETNTCIPLKGESFQCVNKSVWYINCDNICGWIFENKFQSLVL